MMRTLNQESIKKISALAEKEFRTGKDRNQILVDELKSNPLFKKKLYQNSQLEDLIEGKRENQTTWLQYANEDFDYCANKIKGTQFIAANGPRDLQELDKFMAMLTTHTPAIEHIVCLGNVVKNRDFLDYYSHRGEIRTAHYKISSHLRDEDKGIEDTSCIGYHISDISITNIKTGVKNSIKVYHLMIPDNCPIDISYLLAQKNKKLLDIFLKLSQIVLTNPLLVHCKYGVGRSGNLIWLLLLFANQKDLSKSTNDEMIAKKIMTLFNMICETRPAFVTELSQFKSGIEGGFYLDEYQKSLENSNIEEEALTHFVYNSENIEQKNSRKP
jgi:protein tyrosine phosphatase